MNKLITTVLLSILVNQAWSQSDTIKSTVLDAETNQPVEGATVIVSPYPHKATTTYSNGRFDILNSEKLKKGSPVRLFVAAPGYSPIINKLDTIGPGGAIEVILLAKNDKSKVFFVYPKYKDIPIKNIEVTSQSDVYLTTNFGYVSTIVVSGKNTHDLDVLLEAKRNYKPYLIKKELSDYTFGSHVIEVNLEIYSGNRDFRDLWVIFDTRYKSLKDLQKRNQGEPNNMSILQQFIDAIQETYDIGKNLLTMPSVTNVEYKQIQETLPINDLEALSGKFGCFEEKSMNKNILDSTSFILDEMGQNFMNNWLNNDIEASIDEYKQLVLFWKKRTSLAYSMNACFSSEEYDSIAKRLWETFDENYYPRLRQILRDPESSTYHNFAFQLLNHLKVVLGR